MNIFLIIWKSFDFSRNGLNFLLHFIHKLTYNLLCTVHFCMNLSAVKLVSSIYMGKTEGEGGDDWNTVRKTNPGECHALKDKHEWLSRSHTAVSLIGTK